MRQNICDELIATVGLTDEIWKHVTVTLGGDELLEIVQFNVQHSNVQAISQLRVWKNLSQ
jgi:hypothetical protein